MALVAYTLLRSLFSVLSATNTFKSTVLERKSLWERVSERMKNHTGGGLPSPLLGHRGDAFLEARMSQTSSGTGSCLFLKGSSKGKKLGRAGWWCPFQDPRPSQPLGETLSRPAHFNRRASGNLCPGACSNLKRKIRGTEPVVLSFASSPVRESI